MIILMDAIRSIRNVRTQLGVAPSRKAGGILVVAREETRGIFEDSIAFLDRLASINSIEFRTDKSGIPATAVTAIFDGGTFFLPLEDLIDIDKELERLNKEKDNLENEVRRVDSKLQNASFVERAPEAVVLAEKEKRDKYVEMLASINDRLTLLQT